MDKYDMILFGSCTGVLAGAVLMYTVASTQMDIRDLKKEAADIAKQVATMKNSETGYAGLTTAMIASSRVLQHQQTVSTSAGPNTGIVTGDGSSIEVAPVKDPDSQATDSAWTLTMNNVSLSACVLYATDGLGLKEYGVAINGIGAPVGPQPLNMNPLPSKAAAESACQQKDNRMTFYVR